MGQENNRYTLKVAWESKKVKDDPNITDSVKPTTIFTLNIIEKNMPPGKTKELPIEDVEPWNLAIE